VKLLQNFKFVALTDLYIYIVSTYSTYLFVRNYATKQLLRVSH